MAQCMFPYYVERQVYHNQKDRLTPVPCGKCPNCLKRRVASWSFRLEMEALEWDQQLFITLTYNTENIPITENSFLTLNPDHLTLFFKKLRKKVGKLKYYLCGEYGTKNKRPHYHLILFTNATATHQDVINTWTNENGHPLGDVYFGIAEAASIKYTVQYYDKGHWTPQHARDDRKPEFSRMSQGLGKNFLTPKMAKHFLENPDLGYIYNKEGHKIAIPRYYKQRLYDYVGNDMLIATHPSLLIHRDEQLANKKIHHASMEKLAETKEKVEQTAELHEDRKQAIINYKIQKRKL